MPSVFKVWTVSYWRPDKTKCRKEESVKVDEQGNVVYQTVTRTRKGKKKTARVPVCKEGYKQQSEQSKNWYGRYRDAQGRPHQVPLCPDKDAAKDMLAALVTEAAKGKVGLTNPFEEHQGRPLAEHLADFRRHLEAKGDTKAHIDRTHNRIKSIIDGCKFACIADLSASRVAEFLSECRRADRAIDNKKRGNRGFGASNFNHFLRAIKGFSAWLVKDRRTGQDVMKHLSGVNVDTDRRLQRRVISEQEFDALLTTTRKAEPFRDLDGNARSVLYLMAATTGLRVSELASVTPASFDLDADPPTVEVQAGYSKRRQHDVLPLHPGLVPTLREFLKGKPADLRVWSGRWWEKAAEMLRLDMAATRTQWIDQAKGAERKRREESDYLTYRDHAGLVFDFHALRGQFISSLARNGVHPKTAQLLARHSDINLTMNVYTHLGLVDLGAAVESIPLPSSASPVQTKTGLQRHIQQTVAG